MRSTSAFPILGWASPALSASPHRQCPPVLGCAGEDLLNPLQLVFIVPGNVKFGSLPFALDFLQPPTPGGHPTAGASWPLSVPWPVPAQPCCPRHGPMAALFKCSMGKGVFGVRSSLPLVIRRTSLCILCPCCSSYSSQPPPACGTYPALSASHMVFRRHPHSGVCQGLDKERGRAGLVIPPVQALNPAGGAKTPCRKTHT